MGQELNRNTKIVNILEDIINQHNLFLLTDVDHNYHHSDLNENAGKSTINLTLIMGLSNPHIRTRAFDLIKIRHMAIEISVNEQEKKEKRNNHFRTKNADWSIWEKILDTELKNFQDSSPTIINPDIIDTQTSALTNIIDSAIAFFGNTETSKKVSKGWWNTDIKNARKAVKNALSKYKKRNTPENSTILQEAKKHYQNLIEMSKLSFHKKQTEYLNQSRDATQFWHRYEKVTGRKTNNTVEPIFDSYSSTYIFDDEVISNRLHDYHIAKSASSLNYNDSFKMSVEEKLQQILNHVECDSSQIFFGEEHIKDTMNKADKNSYSGPDKINQN